MGNVPLYRDIRYFIRLFNASEAHPEASSILTTGNIPESTLSSALIRTVIDNNVTFIRFLLIRNGNVNTQDDQGFTLLHIAIMNNSKDAFNCLIRRSNINVNLTNRQQQSPLFTAALSDKPHFVKKLLRKGAVVNIRDKLGCIPLHYACQHASPRICHLLIQAGSDINAQNFLGETPLYQSCRFKKTETIFMLLYYGADSSIPSNSGIIPVMVEDLELETRIALYLHTFDDFENTIDLKVFTRSMILKWPVFPIILDRVAKVSYQKEDLRSLSEGIVDMKTEDLQMFWGKFDYIIKDMLHHCCTLTTYLTAIENMKRAPAGFMSMLDTLIQSDLIDDLVQSRCISVSPISSLINIFRKNKLPLTSLTNIVLCFLSHGISLTAADLNAVYVFYGRCELFEILLHMDIETSKSCVPCCTLYDHEVMQQSIMPYFIYDVNLNIDTFLENPQSYLLMDLDVMLSYFASPKLKEFFLAAEPSNKELEMIKKLPTVPRLVELARNATRRYIICRLEIKNSCQFYTALNRLPVENVYKKIISYEKKIYLL